MNFLEKWIDMDDIKKFVWAIYILQFLALFTAGLSFLIAGFLAYLKYDDSLGTIEETHLAWQIKTFWFTLAGLILGIIMLAILIGKFVLLFTELWLLYRVIKGSIYYYNKREIDNHGFF